jgi:hypothetical protein
MYPAEQLLLEEAKDRLWRSARRAAGLFRECAAPARGTRVSILTLRRPP